MEESVTMINTSGWATSWGGSQTITLFIAPETWYYYITWDIYSTYSYYSGSATLSWWTAVNWSSTWYTSWYWASNECLYYVTSWTEVKLTITAGYVCNVSNFNAILWKYYDVPHWEQFPVYPREIREIWKQASTTLYWRDINWNYKGWIMLWTSSTATTGSVTLWNAVWYITVSLNWETVKIPYYNY